MVELSENLYSAAFQKPTLWDARESPSQDDILLEALCYETTQEGC